MKPLINDGASYGIGLAFKHVLALLERTKVVDHQDVVIALDAALTELQSKRGSMTSEATAAAGIAIGRLY